MKVLEAEATEIVEYDSDSLPPKTNDAEQISVKHKVRKCRNCHAVVESSNILCPHCKADLKRKPRSAFRKKLQELFKSWNRLLNINIKKKPKTETEKKKTKYRW